MSKDNTRNSAIAVDVRFRSGKSPHTIFKYIDEDLLRNSVSLIEMAPILSRHQCA